MIGGRHMACEGAMGADLPCVIAALPHGCLAAAIWRMFPSLDPERVAERHRHYTGRYPGQRGVMVIQAPAMLRDLGLEDSLYHVESVPEYWGTLGRMMACGREGIAVLSGHATYVDPDGRVIDCQPQGKRRRVQEAWIRRGNAAVIQREGWPWRG